MVPSKKIEFNGKLYPEYAVTLCSSPIINGNDYTTSAVLNLVPMRVNEETDEIELLEERRVTLVFSDIKGQAKPAELQAFGKINAAIQELINYQNL